jgi:hypothetical protein
LAAGKTTISSSTPNQFKGKAGWNDDVKEYKEKATFWHSIWRDNGQPRNGVVADIRRHTQPLPKKSNVSAILLQ